MRRLDRSGRLHSFSVGRLIVGVTILALLLSNIFMSGTSFAATSQGYQKNLHRQSSPVKKSKIQDEGDWFQLSHFGKVLPTPDAYTSALQQLPELPVATTPYNSWFLLGPQSINTTTCSSSICNPPYGKVSGRVTAIAFNPTNNQDVWLGAADGGLWHSTNGGKNWKSITITVLGADATFAIGAIAIDTKSGNPYTVYVGTGEGNLNGDAYWGTGILKSSDGGATWTLNGVNQFKGIAITKLAVDPSNSNHVLVAATFAYDPTRAAPPNGAKLLGHAGIWLWDQSNSTTPWTQVLADASSPRWDAGTDILFDPAHPGEVFAGLGNAFSQPDSKSFTSIAGVYESTGGGVAGSWHQLTAGIPGGNTVERVSLGISSDGQHVYAVLTNAGSTSPCTASSGGTLLNGSIYVSANNGANWSAKSVAGVTGMVDDDGGCQWWYDSVAAVDPTDSSGNTCFVGGVDLWMTNDGGTTWVNLTNAYDSQKTAHVHPDIHALAFFGTPTTNSSFYLGTDGGIWNSTTGGDSFKNLNNDLSITQFYGGSMSDEGIDSQVYGGAQDNGEAQYPQTSQGPTAWNQVMGGDGGDTVVDYIANNVVYGEVLSPLTLYKSTDGGNTWNSAMTGLNPNGTDPVNFVMPFIMSPNNRYELFAGTDRVYRTTNSAASWAAISGSLDHGEKLSALAVAPNNDSMIYTGDDAGHIFVTTNGGSTWSETTPNSTGGMVTGLAVDPTNANTVYATFADFAAGTCGQSCGKHVFQSTDAGGHWTDISMTLPNIPFESVIVSPADLSVIVGSDVGVFISSDGGVQWSRLGSGLPKVAIDQLFTNYRGSDLFVATHGRGIWMLPLCKNWCAVASPNIAKRGNILNGMAAISSNDIWTVGDASISGSIQTLTEHWNGTGWSIVPGSNPVMFNWLNGVAAASSNDVWAVGTDEASSTSAERTLIEHWDGTGWSVVPSPNVGTGYNSLSGVAAISSNDVWAVGSYEESNYPYDNQTLIEHWDGTSWSVVSSPNPTNGGWLAAVAADSSTDIWAVGQGGAGGQTLTEHWNGTSWSIVPSPTPGGENDDELLGVAAITSTDIWAIGYQNTGYGEMTLTEHWDGTSWSVVSSPNTAIDSQLNGIAVISTNDIWAMGYYYTGAKDQTLIEHWNGTSWSIIPSFSAGTGSNFLGGGVAVTSTDVWAVGYYQNKDTGPANTLVLRYNPSQFL